MSVSLDQLKAPKLLYKSLAAKLVVGMPFKVYSRTWRHWTQIILRELPPIDDSDAVRDWLYPLVVTSPLKSWKSSKTSMLQCFFIKYPTMKIKSAECLQLGGKNVNGLNLLNPYGLMVDDLVINAGTIAGAHLVDGLGDGVLLESLDQDFDFLRNTSFNLLHCCRMRNTKTEYVPCPSCDLQEISAQIREKTSHLPGVSIAIMGCIVNGPGEWLM
ncbi:hypothetical protein Gorai_011565 [Gossypium raimondii]|uniref:IspG C-terminal domain-containing protein n=1 Tax=Gossypium raimondii TaxID=29730 RepID=A0A7J8PZM8_GOSRA|nr:hypothetical protein [Gossypium raimondii]